VSARARCRASHNKGSHRRQLNLALKKARGPTGSAWLCGCFGGTLSHLYFLDGGVAVGGGATATTVVNSEGGDMDFVAVGVPLWSGPRTSYRRGRVPILQWGLLPMDSHHVRACTLSCLPQQGESSSSTEPRTEKKREVRRGARGCVAVSEALCPITILLALAASYAAATPSSCVICCEAAVARHRSWRILSGHHHHRAVKIVDTKIWSRSGLLHGRTRPRSASTFVTRSHPSFPATPHGVAAL
jgi:hypothetical protein